MSVSRTELNGNSYCSSTQRVHPSSALGSHALYTPTRTGLTSSVSTGRAVSSEATFRPSALATCSTRACVPWPGDTRNVPAGQCAPPASTWVVVRWTTSPALSSRLTATNASLVRGSIAYETLAVAGTAPGGIDAVETFSVGAATASLTLSTRTPICIDSVQPLMS